MHARPTTLFALASVLGACFSPDGGNLNETESETSGQPTGTAMGDDGNSGPVTTAPTSDTTPTSDTDPTADTATTDADADADTNADADTGTDTGTGTTGTPIEPQCGDGIPVATELCFDEAPLVLAVGSNPVAVAVGDLTLNGLLDIVSLNHGMTGQSPSLTVLEADGIGGFVLGDTLGAPDAGFQLRILDADDDGDADIFAAGSGDLMHYRNQAAFFASSVASSWFGGDWQVGELVVLDVTGDDIVDAVYTEAYAQSVHAGTLSVAGWGTTNGGTQLPIPGEGAAGMIAATLAADGDEDIDIVSLNQYYSTVEVVTNDGTGTFTQQTSPGLCPGVSEGVRHGDAGDFDGDGTIDIVATCMSGDIGVALDDGAGNFASFTTLPLAGAFRPTVADVDGDGALDLVVTSFALNRAVVFRGDGNGGFALSDALLVAGASVYGTAIADLDDDGAMDIVIASNANGGEVQVFLANP